MYKEQNFNSRTWSPRNCILSLCYLPLILHVSVKWVRAPACIRASAALFVYRNATKTCTLLNVGAARLVKWKMRQAASLSAVPGLTPSSVSHREGKRWRWHSGWRQIALHRILRRSRVGHLTFAGCSWALPSWEAFRYTGYRFKAQFYARDFYVITQKEGD